MSTTDFTDGVTLSAAGWADDVDSSAYSVLSVVAGTNTITATGPATYSYAATRPPVWFIPAVTNTAAATMNVTPSGSSALGAKNIFCNGVSLRGGELVAGIPVAIIYDGTQFSIVATGAVPMVDPKICDGRLTGSTGVPVTTADVTAIETLFFTPYKGNKIALYTGATWKLYTFAELSVDVPDATQMNDVFGYDNSGTLALETVAWTNDTTRATALTTQDGVLVKTGTVTKRYLGSFYATTAGNGQTEDSFAKRYVWNYYNRVVRPMRVNEATDSWPYTTATIRQANGSTANQLDFAIGVSEDDVEAFVLAAAANDNAGVSFQVLIGLDATNAMASAGQTNQIAVSYVAANSVPLFAQYRGFPGIGKHFLAWLEYSTSGVGTTTWSGDSAAPTLRQSGIHGRVFG